MLVNAYVTHREPPPLTFPHEIRSRRDRSDPELGRHLRGFGGFVMDRGKRPMTAIRYGVLRHLERVRHQLAIEVESVHMSAVERWARDANALLFLPDASVRAPDGKVLVAPDTGDPERGAEIPFPPDASERKGATEALLASHGIRVPKSLPPVVAETEVELRGARDVASRVLALFACAIRGESLASGKPIATTEIEKRLPLAFAAMSPKERTFIADDAPARQDVVNHIWRYESLVPLAWAVGLFEGLPFPSAACNAPRVARTILDLDGESFLSGARLRSTGELLDALDSTFRLHWATTDARATTTAAPAGVEPGVVAERHYALNWLTRFEEADWDDVTTPT